MTDPARRPRAMRSALALVAAFLVVVVGAYVFVSLRGQGNSAASLLRPAPLQFAPYQYVAYSGSLDDTRQATDVKQLFAAFVISDGTCTPVWGGSKANGLESPRSAAIAADIAQVRAAGGEVAVSFGGQQGLELATVCPDVGTLTAAYRSVITKYGLERVDFDIEGAALRDSAANSRRAEAIANLQRTQPDLQVWVTLPVDTNGLTSDGYALLERLRNREVVLNGINLMTMNYNVGSADLGASAIRTTEGAFGQVKALYPGASDATVWRMLSMTVMVGRNDTAPETMTLKGAREVRDFASSRGVGTVSMWSVERDAPCPPGTDTSVANPTCSGVGQQRFDFIRALEGRPGA